MLKEKKAIKKEVKTLKGGVSLIKPMSSKSHSSINIELKDTGKHNLHISYFTQASKLFLF